jgi:RimJ/RimL family protein N-acetyltransferase
MSSSSVTIRPITRDEVPQWWELRLRALKDHPEAFGSDYETSRQRGYGPVIERNFGPDAGINTIFAAFDDAGTILSTVGVFGETGKRSHIANVIGVYTRPETRGQGLCRRLIDAAIAHCRAASGIHQVHISVNADNAPALHVYEAAEFIAWGTEPRAIALPDRYDDEIHLALMLDDGARNVRP